jgi:hypothetical protein
VVFKTFGEWYQKTNKTEDTNKLTLLAFKIEVHRTPLIWRPQAPDQGSTVGGLLSVSPPEEHHERRMFLQTWRQSKNV